MSGITLNAEASALIERGDKDASKLSASERIKYEVYKKAKDTIATKITDIISPLTDKIAMLTFKKTESSAGLTEDEQKELDTAINTRQLLVDSLISDNSTTTQELVTTREKNIQALISKIGQGKPSPAEGLSAVRPGNLVEYLIRTQAINPYARERVCDIKFIEMLALVAAGSNSAGDDIAKLKSYIKAKIDAYAKGE